MVRRTFVWLVAFTAMGCLSKPEDDPCGPANSFSKSWQGNDPTLFDAKGANGQVAAFELAGADNRYSLYIEVPGVCTKEHISGVTITIMVDLAKVPPSLDPIGYLSSASIFAARRQTMNVITGGWEITMPDLGLTQAWKDGPGTFSAGIELRFPVQGATIDEQKAAMRTWLKSITIRAPFKDFKK